MGFCPKCGKKTKVGFCIDCRPAEEISAKDITIMMCASCKKYLHKNKWSAPDSINSAILRVARDSIKGATPDMDIEPQIQDYKIVPGANYDIMIDISGKSGVFSIPAKLKVSYCDNCSKKQGKYFEGILQLRRPSEEVLDFIDNYVKGNSVFISDKKEKDDGLDLYISDQRKLQNLGNLLKKNFGGELKVSIRQFTQDRLTSRQVYRVNALYEAPHYKKGDVVKFRNSVYQITSARKTISAVCLKDGKKATLPLDKEEYTLLNKFETKVSKVYPQIEIFDEETYQSVPVENTREVKMSEKVRVVNDSGLFYIV